ncbi:hypothetical protein EZS27_015481 [termite gut metagenome]|uniref:Glycogen synthase n=1 Tax=termite gut metagenome TaxID=433724 RepID=A0A5J4RTI1_9ZZZZ
MPKGVSFTEKRKEARRLMLNVANNLLGTNWEDDTLIIGISGRYEFKNKGIDVYLESLNRLANDKRLKKNVLAFVIIPAWVSEARKDLQERLQRKEQSGTSLEIPFITHWLYNLSEDKTLGMLRHLNMNNLPNDKIKVIFIPCYLDGKDGIFNKPYYELLLGQDLSVYPSYYEPWGYTPLESVAFGVPTITTDLSGFGRWVQQELENHRGITDGVEVLHRTDNNYFGIADAIKDTVVSFSSKSDEEITQICKCASEVAEQALWKHFIIHYYQAYDTALRNADKRKKMMNNPKKDTLL